MKVTAAELRAEIARRQVPLYKLAAWVEVHPGRLGMILGGRLPLTPVLAKRVVEALEVMGRDQDDL